jgi:hypothetical protein
MRAEGTITLRVSKTKKVSYTAPVVELSTTGIIACGTRDAAPSIKSRGRTVRLAR